MGLERSENPSGALLLAGGASQHSIEEALDVLPNCFVLLFVLLSLEPWGTIDCKGLPTPSPLCHFTPELVFALWVSHSLARVPPCYSSSPEGLWALFHSALHHRWGPLSSHMHSPCSSYLQIPVNHPHLVAVQDGLQDLLDAVAVGERRKLTQMAGEAEFCQTILFCCISPLSPSGFPSAALQHSSASPSTSTHTPVGSSSNPVRTQQSFWTPSNGVQELWEHS